MSLGPRRCRSRQAVSRGSNKQPWHEGLLLTPRGRGLEGLCSRTLAWFPQVRQRGADRGDTTVTPKAGSREDCAWLRSPVGGGATSLWLLSLEGRGGPSERPHVRWGGCHVGRAHGGSGDATGLGARVPACEPSGDPDGSLARGPEPLPSPRPAETGHERWLPFQAAGLRAVCYAATRSCWGASDGRVCSQRTSPRSFLLPVEGVNVSGSCRGPCGARSGKWPTLDCGSFQLTS